MGMKLLIKPNCIKPTFSPLKLKKLICPPRIICKISVNIKQN